MIWRSLEAAPKSGPSQPKANQISHIPLRSFVCRPLGARLLHLAVEICKYVAGTPTTCLSSTYSRKTRFTNHPQRHPAKVGTGLAIGIGVGDAIGAATHQLAIGVGFEAAFGVAVGPFDSRKKTRRAQGTNTS
jgi:hypothetical protein